MDYVNVISLTELSVNKSGTIAALNNAVTEAIRLVSLGFTPGAEISMAQNYGFGPLIVSVRGTRVALSRVEAGKIFVQRKLA